MTTESPALSRPAARSWRRRWDLQQSRWVPEREARFRALVETLGQAMPRTFRALDLGCGTGSLSERILARHPAARVVAVDFDPVLLAMGRIALGARGGRLTWVDADLRRASWIDAIPCGPFDAAVSSTALHWLNDRQIGRLYRQLGRRLRRGGVFLNADHLSFDPAARRLRTLARVDRREGYDTPPARGETWTGWWSAAARDPRLRREMTLRRRRYPHSHHGTATPDLEGHVRALRRAGFREVELVWSRWENRILCAIR